MCSRHVGGGRGDGKESDFGERCGGRMEGLERRQLERVLIFAERPVLTIRGVGSPSESTVGRGLRGTRQMMHNLKNIKNRSNGTAGQNIRNSRRRMNIRATRGTNTDHPAHVDEWELLRIRQLLTQSLPSLRAHFFRALCPFTFHCSQSLHLGFH